MAVTPAAFKISFPEFSTLSDAEIQRFIDEASACVSVSAWSARADTGVSYLTAHLLSEFGTGATGGVFGFGAVKLIAEGEFGKMVALQGNKIVPVELKEATTRIKTVSKEIYELAKVFFG